MSVEFVRVEYDVDEAMHGPSASSELPDEFADYLRTGGQPTATVSPEST